MVTKENKNNTATTEDLLNRQKKNQLSNKIYHTQEILDVMGDVAKDYMEQVALMKDEELAYDRSNWILKYGDGNGAFDENTYEVDIHTIAILIEQIRRFGRIIYHLSGKNVRLDNKK